MYNQDMNPIERITTTEEGKRATVLLRVIADKGGLVIGDRVDNRGNIWEKNEVQQMHLIEASQITKRVPMEMDFYLDKLVPAAGLSDGHHRIMSGA